MLGVGFPSHNNGYAMLDFLRHDAATTAEALIDEVLEVQEQNFLQVMEYLESQLDGNPNVTPAIIRQTWSLWNEVHNASDPAFRDFHHKQMRMFQNKLFLKNLNIVLSNPINYDIRLPCLIIILLILLFPLAIWGIKLYLKQTLTFILQNSLKTTQGTNNYIINALTLVSYLVFLLAFFCFLLEAGRAISQQQLIQYQVQIWLLVLFLYFCTRETRGLQILINALLLVSILVLGFIINIYVEYDGKLPRDALVNAFAALPF